MRHAVSLLGVLAVVTVALSASADPRGKVFTMKTVEIIGKRIVPIASVEVGKAPASVAPAELKQQLVDRIDATAHSSAL